MTHFVEQDSQAPDVDFVVLFVFVQNFWRHVFLSAALRDPHLSLSKRSTKSEVAELHISVLFDKNVLWLDVSVEDAFLMNIVQRGNYLIKNLENFFFREFFTIHEFPQVPFLYILENNIQRSPIGMVTVHLDNARMVQLNLQVYFSLDGPKLIRLHPVQVNDFNCILFFGVFVYCQVDLRNEAKTQLLIGNNLEVLKLSIRLTHP